jgi:hypothetical protein
MGTKMGVRAGYSHLLNRLMAVCIAFFMVIFDISKTTSVYANGVKYNISCTTEVLMDYALVSSASMQEGQVIYAVNSQCYKCSHTALVSYFVNQFEQCSMLWTPHTWTLYLVDTVTGTQLNSMVYSFGDQGKYDISVATDVDTKEFIISVRETKPPVDTLEPLYIAIGLFLFVGILSFVGPVAWSRFKEANWPNDDRSSFASAGAPLLAPETDNGKNIESKFRLMEDNASTGRGSLTSRQSLASANADDRLLVDEETGKRSATPASSKHSVADIPVASQVANTTTAAAAPVRAKPSRVNSLDTFRGFSLCIMIFVNYGGGGYWFFDHAPWHGLTFADLLFPWFMWMMGVSMALSFSALGLIIAEPAVSNASSTAVANRPVEYRSAPWSAWSKVLQRSATLFALGMFLANGYDYKTWRIPGVLQYFAVSYLVTSATVLFYLPTTNVSSMLCN